jgi:hypothetical protein
MGGTSREVLEELLRWKCETLVFHNANARATFHPKMYLFESESSATLFIGSSNLTDGGLYTNYEAVTRYDFGFPDDNDEFQRLLLPLLEFLEPRGPTTQILNAQLISVLVARGELPSETDVRQARRKAAAARRPMSENIPSSPFPPVPTPLPPLLPKSLREEEPKQEATPIVTVAEEVEQKVFTDQHLAAWPDRATSAKGNLVWRKPLPATDALDVKPGSHPVGGVRLTQARFEDAQGQRIDQTTYFRRLFADYDWEPEGGRHKDQEHTFIAMRIIIRGKDYGIRNFEVSHKPSGESGQDNYTTILRWGSEFTPIVLQENLTGTVLSLFETNEPDADFLIEIEDA